MIENFKLRVFPVVADSLNFRGTADELHLTQPAITAQVKMLEESLGIALLDRIGREVNLTPACTLSMRESLTRCIRPAATNMRAPPATMA